MMTIVYLNSANTSVFEFVRVSVRWRHVQQFAVGSAGLRFCLRLGLQQCRRCPVVHQQSTSPNGIRYAPIYSSHYPKRNFRAYYGTE